MARIAGERAALDALAQISRLKKLKLANCARLFRAERHTSCPGPEPGPFKAGASATIPARILLLFTMGSTRPEPQELRLTDCRNYGFARAPAILSWHCSFREAPSTNHPETSPCRPICGRPRPHRRDRPC